MTRIEILDIINEIIVEEHGKPLNENQLLTECDIDSFGYAMLWLGLTSTIKDRTGIEVFSKQDLKVINYEDLTVNKLLNMIEDKLCI